MTSSGNADAAAAASEVRVDTPGGRVFVRQAPGEDPPVVLMHGFPDDHQIYRKLLPQLSPRRAVAFDFLGYGRSDRPEDAGFSPDDHGSQLTAVLDELGIARAVIVGHDASGPDAVFYAVAHPERVAGLVLLNTVFGHQKSLKMPEMTRLFAEPDLSSLADDLTNDPNQLLWFMQRWGAQLGLDSADPDGVAAQSVLPQFFGGAGHPAALASIRAWTAGWLGSLDKQDALINSGALRRLELPVSVIFGEKDRYLNPSVAAEISPLFNNPSCHLVHDAGHYPQHDQPAMVADLIKRAACPPQNAVIEVRTYRAKPGKRAELLAIVRQQAFPLQRRLGMKLIGPLPATEDEVTFVWLRAFPGEASREPLKAAFYGGPDWTDDLEAKVMPLLDHYGAVVVDDTVGLWDAWPEPAS
jgi:haloalkane dehalogenase